MTGRTAERGPIRVLELRSVRGTGGGPEKTILFGAAATNPARAAITVCYIRDVRDSVFRIDARAQALGVTYLELVERHSFDRSLVSKLRALLDTHRIDVVHSHDYKTDLLAWLLARQGSTRILSTAHGWTGHSRRERYVYYPADRRLLARFPLVLAVSSEIRRALLAAGARSDRVRVVLNAIDPQTFRRDASREGAARARFALPPDCVAVGSVGRLEPQKRFDLLIEACVRVRRRVPALRLLIAGEGSERPKLEALIRSHDAAGWCRLTGQLGDIAELHHGLDLFVQSSDYEGTPNVVLEAMALETPIVATDAGGTAEVCRPFTDGLIVPAGNASVLAEAMLDALTDAAGRVGRVRAARQRVEGDLSFAARVCTLEGIYEELVQEASCVAG